MMYVNVRGLIIREAEGEKQLLIQLRKRKGEAEVYELPGGRINELTQTLAIEANVLDKASLESACKTVLKKWKRVDVLINGAGGNHPKGTTPAEQMTKETKLEDTFFGLF